MQKGPQAGAFFENFILDEILKYKFNHNVNFEIYFYRDSNHNEIDFILDYGISTKLIEAKLTATPREEHFSVIKKIIPQFKEAHGYLISFSNEKVTIAKGIEMLPWSEMTTKL